MKTIKVFLVLMTLTLYANANSVMKTMSFSNIESNVVYQSLIQETVRHGWTIIGELILALILTCLFFIVNIKMNLSVYWKKYVMMKFVTLELFLIVIGILYYHSLTNLPIAVDYIYNPAGVIYKYFMK